MIPAMLFENIATQAFLMGASLVGAIRVAPLLDSPSHRLLPVNRQVPKTHSLIVLALEHPEGEPEMDWWDNQAGRTPGNRQLIKINRRLAKWLKKMVSAEACDLPYNPGKNGLFLNCQC
jgi:epoxyqueuosine reductase